MIPLVLVLYVDVASAIVETEDGRKAKDQLAAAHARASEEIRKREQQLREIADPDRYDREAEKLQKDAAEQQKQLDAMQDRSIAPIVEKMRKLMGKEVFDLSEQPLIDAPKECDVTAWLVRAYAKKAPLPSVEGCRYRGFVYIDFDRALVQSKAGAAATKRLDALKEKSQAEIDRRQRQLAEIERSLRAGDREKRAQYEQERREVAQLFARHQRDMDLAAQTAEEDLYAALEVNVSAAARRFPGVLFVEGFAEQRKLEPHCDGTEWAAKLLDGKGNATELRAACPLAQ